jgi:hypothetical protein
MKKSRYKIIFFLLLFSAREANAGYRSEIYSAYINNKMELWKDVIDRMDAVKGKSDEMFLELVNYQYGYIGYCIGYNKKDEAIKYLGLAFKNIEFLEEQQFNLSIINSYKSAFYGYRIVLNILSAPLNGLKSIEFARAAVELDPQNYLGYIQHGNIQFYMPSLLGGSKKEALGYYLKAKEMIEKEPGGTFENWNYMNLLIVIGQTYYYLNEINSAKSILEVILKLEPGFMYVRDELYPQLLKKMEN